MTVGTFERENPARVDEVVGSFLPASPAQVAQVVAEVGAAQRDWRAVAVEDRVARLRRAASRLRADLSSVAELTARETGKVLADCVGEASFAAAVLEWYCDNAGALLADREVDDARGRVMMSRRPYGVVAAITPWNAPLVLTMLKLAPALVAGNGIVVKPSPLAPFGVLSMLRLLAGELPPGTVQIVLGDADVAKALVSDPGVHRIAFTGGATAGRAVAALAGEALTPSVLELGGNDPALVLADADLSEAALDRLVMATFATSGQVCMAVKRIYVHSSLRARFIEGYQDAATRVLRLGDPLHEGSTIGPVVTRESAARLHGLLEDAVSRGGQAVPLGSVDPETDLGRGHYVQPTLVIGANQDDPLVAGEQFGPVVPLITFESVDEAVALANAGDLGLGASVWSADEDEAFAVARRIEAGFTFVNTHNRTGLALHLPFGGVKRSGWGREYGEDGLLEYVQTCVAHAPSAFRHGSAGLDASAYPGTS